MTTNAQAALQAAATWLSTDSESQDEQVTLFADKFKVWLDGQDDADREARRKQPVPKGAGRVERSVTVGGPGEVGRPSVRLVPGVRESMQEHYRG